MRLFSRRRSKPKSRTVIVGLDGVPFSLVRDLTEKGRLRNMAGLLQSGYFGRMTVSIPEISSVSWSSFMTGTNCGRHGIFGFMDLRPGTYEMFFPSFSNLQVPTIWDELGGRQKRSVVINLPSTYPAREIPGVLISGFVAIDLKKAVYPPSLIPVLENLGYRIDIDTTRARKDHDFLVTDLDHTLKFREKALDHLWDNEDWDVLMVVVTGTDRVNHYLWDAYEDESHRYNGAFLDYYEKVDRFIGSIHEKYQALSRDQDCRNTFVMLSDHGFTGIRSEVYLNRWLEENGFLKFNRQPPKSLNDLGAGTKAFALDPSRIYIHRKGRYPRGKVDSRDVPRLMDDIRNGILAMEMNGDRVLRSVLAREEIYDGPLLDDGPDLVCVSNHGFDLKGSIRKENIFEKTDLTGMHTQDDAFFYCDQDISCQSIFEVKDLILKTLA
jgi:predicted AlkP superfamily phosphohydrolase/phosphomutase